MRSLRVLRSFRVLRVMKMFKYLESLKVIAAVLISSMASFASIVVLMVLFWLVFAIVGLHVFGGLALDKPWPNFDTLIASLILTFNVRTHQLLCWTRARMWEWEGEVWYAACVTGWMKTVQNQHPERHNTSYFYPSTAPTQKHRFSTWRSLRATGSAWSGPATLELRCTISRGSLWASSSS